MSRLRWSPVDGSGEVLAWCMNEIPCVICQPATAPKRRYREYDEAIGIARNFETRHFALVHHPVVPSAHLTMFTTLFRPNANASAGPSRLASASSAHPAPSISPALDTATRTTSPLPQPISSALRASTPSAPRAPPKLPQSVIEKNYTGPDRASLPAQRTRSQAEKYFARVASENVAPGRWSKALSIGGWVLGACESIRHGMC